MITYDGAVVGADGLAPVVEVVTSASLVAVAIANVVGEAVVGNTKTQQVPSSKVQGTSCIITPALQVAENPVFRYWLSVTRCSVAISELIFTVVVLPSQYRVFIDP